MCSKHRFTSTRQIGQGQTRATWWGGGVTSCPLTSYEWKHSRAVLRGGGGGDVTSLPDPQGSNPLGPPGPEPMTCGGPSGQRRSTDRDDQRGRGPSRCPPGTDRTRSGPASSIRPFLVSTQLEQDVEVLQGGDIAGGLVAGGDIAQ